MTTPTSSTTPPFIDPRPILDRAIATGGAVIVGVQPDQLTAPTPCPEMDVRTMLSHLIGVLDRIAALDHATLRTRPKLGPADVVTMGWRALWMRPAAAPLARSAA